MIGNLFMFSDIHSNDVQLVRVFFSTLLINFSWYSIRTTCFIVSYLLNGFQDLLISWWIFKVVLMGYCGMASMVLFSTFKSWFRSSWKCFFYQVFMVKLYLKCCSILGAQKELEIQDFVEGGAGAASCISRMTSAPAPRLLHLHWWGQTALWSLGRL